jgi:hypothetical protein
VFGRVGLTARSFSYRWQKPFQPERCRGHPKGLSLYGDLEVKHLFHAFSTSYFLHSSFFVRPRIPFLRPDPHIVEAGARRGRQGRPSL